MMSLNRVSGVALAALMMIAAGQSYRTGNVQAGIFGTKCLDQTGCCDRCPACDHKCKLDAKIVDEDKPCFDVESKVICIPRVVFPWQKKKCHSCDACDGAGCSSCINNGARVRRICVLKFDKYKCPKCKYTWSAEKAACCDTGCDAPGCDNAVLAPYQQPQPAVGSEVMPAAPMPAAPSPSAATPIVLPPNPHGGDDIVVDAVTN